MNAASLNENLRKALDDYHDLDELSRSPLQSLQALWDSDDIASPTPELLWQGLALQSLLNRALNTLAESLPEQSELLDLRFRKQLPMKAMQTRFNLRPARIYELITQAIISLGAIVVAMENRALLRREQRRRNQLESVPVIDGRAIGLESAVADIRTRLAQQLSTLGMPLLVAGLGGIGKTTLVLEAVRSWVVLESPLIERVLWVPIDSTLFIDTESAILGTMLATLAEQMSLSLDAHLTVERQLDQIARYFSSRMRQYVLVIDNIETEIETRAVLQLTKALRGYTPIVLTSRRTFDFERGGIQLFAVHELPKLNALALVAQETERLGLPPLPPLEVERIYEMVGGHPLSLKLVVAQRRFLPLDEISAMFGKSASFMENLFNNIYAVTWKLLTPVAEAVVTGMTLLPPSGGYWDVVATNAEAMHPGLPRQELMGAIQLLTQLNLLQLTYIGNHQTVYSLHRLTYQYVERRGGLELEDG